MLDGRAAKPSRREVAERFAREVADRIPRCFAAQVRSWAPAIELTAPIAERLSGLLLEWEMTGDRLIGADVGETEAELMLAWLEAERLWTDTAAGRA